MAVVEASYGFYFAEPLWLLAGLLVVPVVWLARRSLGQLNRARRLTAVVLRVLVVLILAAILARPTVTRSHKQMTVQVVLDRSLSIPMELKTQALGYLAKALEKKKTGDQLAVVDVGEAAMIARLPSGGVEIPQRNTTLTGEQTDLAGGVQLSMAIAPPETGTRMLLVTDGNQTVGDLREAARIAAANRIPIDVLPLQYRYPQEVVFKRLVAPPTARSGQTVALRFVLHSTAPARGRLVLSLNGQPVDLDPGSPGMAAAVTLKAGANVKTISLPIGRGGMHKFECTFIPDATNQDTLAQNNRASGMTFVAGPGHVLVVGDEKDAGSLTGKLRSAGLDARGCPVANFPDSLAELVGTDALILVNTPNSGFSYEQQEMICRYVTELGGGLVVVGGPDAFGAGGWIGSPVAKVLPVDLDPPQKKQLPRGALVLIMHACEMPRGNYWGKRVAIAAIRSLSRLDYVGVLEYGWGAGGASWVYKFSLAGDKTKAVAAVKRMQMGDMPDFGTPMTAAYNALKGCNAGQKHIIIISDGDPSPPSRALISNLQKSRITCTGVVVFPHSDQDRATLAWVAKQTGGRFYFVKDPKRLPQIFVKEAQVVRRALIMEEPFVPEIVNALSETVRGVDTRLPKLDGFVLTGPKGGLNQLVIATPKGDPVMAAGQQKLGRSVAFTSGAGTRWAKDWVGGWGGYERFWEQVVRWAGKPAQASDCEIFADVQGREVTITVDAVDAEGNFVQFANLVGQVIDPDMSVKSLALAQIGPGRYRSRFRAGPSGSYLVNLRYRKPGAEGETGLVQTAVTVPYAPEFRDLSDNTALLTSIAQATGGRVLSGDPEQEDLFERAGVQFPNTALPLTKHLFILWLGLFLLDVASRRIAVDFRALARRLWAASAGRLWVRGARAAATVERLRTRTRAVREQMAARRSEPLARKRYDKAEAGAPPLPMAAAEEPQPRPEAEKTPAEAPKPAQPQTAEHLQRLLRAKRQAKDRMQDK